MKMREVVSSQRNASVKGIVEFCCFECLLWLTPRFGCLEGICPVGELSSWKHDCFDVVNCLRLLTLGLIRRVIHHGLSWFLTHHTSCLVFVVMSIFCGDLCWASIWRSEEFIFIFWSPFFGISATFPELLPSSKASPNLYHPQKKRSCYFYAQFSVSLPCFHLSWCYPFIWNFISLKVSSSAQIYLWLQSEVFDPLYPSTWANWYLFFEGLWGWNWF